MKSTATHLRLKSGWYLDQPVLPIWLVGLITAYLVVVIAAVMASPPNLGRLSSDTTTSQPTPAKTPTPKASPAVVPPTPAPAPAARIETYNQDLKPDPGLQQILDNYNGSTPPSGVVVLDNTDKIYAAIEPEQIRSAASLYKLFVAREIYDFRAQGKLSFDQPLTVTQEAASQDNNNVNDLLVGATISISDCMQRMIAVSDNTCGFLLGGIIGWNNVNETLHVRGYNQTSLGSEQLTSAGDVGLLLRRVANRQMVDKQSSGELETILFQQQLNDGLPALLPSGAVGHKTGELNGLVHDAGIVHAKDKTYEIVVMSGPWSSVDKANSSIAALSLEVYNYIIKYKPAPGQ